MKGQIHLIEIDLNLDLLVVIVLIHLRGPIGRDLNTDHDLIIGLIRVLYINQILDQDLEVRVIQMVSFLHQHIDLQS